MRDLERLNAEDNSREGESGAHRGDAETDRGVGAVQECRRGFLMEWLTAPTGLDCVLEDRDRNSACESTGKLFGRGFAP